MASLKEVKSRIQSVNSTRQITSAMKMVSSAKLHKAQRAINEFYPYQHKLNEILNNFLEYERRNDVKHFIPFSNEREVKKVAIIAVSSNTSLCGAFNASVIKLLEKTIEDYSYLGAENILVIPIGKKVTEYAKRLPNVYDKNLDKFVNKPDYNSIADFADFLSQKFIYGEFDKIEFIYQHFKTTSTQALTRETYLPFNLDREIAYMNEAERRHHDKIEYEVNYIVEPNRQELMDLLVPKVIRLKLYTIILDSIAAEYSARTVAMQIATDNADDLLQTLKVQYNKSRQQVITNELLDIIGGTTQ
ncbi:MAG: ATP synthase F1 subunit gamma [Bacteroidales bacterium]|jgi:F-type H+-transporting ATPase subunit gamma|nr:ATP synthase F1 subunit gamma [Bacteroidales bacterium]